MSDDALIDACLRYDELYARYHRLRGEMIWRGWAACVSFLAAYQAGRAREQLWALIGAHSSSSTVLP